MRRILEAIGNLLGIVLGIVSIPVALFMGLLFTALPIVFVLWFLGVWPVENNTNEPIVQPTTQSGEDQKMRPGECYALRALAQLSMAEALLCSNCPHIFPSEVCEVHYELHNEGMALWESRCQHVPETPTETDLQLTFELLQLECTDVWTGTGADLFAECGDKELDEWRELWLEQYCTP